MPFKKLIMDYGDERELKRIRFRVGKNETKIDEKAHVKSNSASK